MNIVTGSGSSRKVLEFPCAEIVNKSPKGEQKQALALVCSLLQIDPESHKAVA